MIVQEQLEAIEAALKKQLAGPRTIVYGEHKDLSKIKRRPKLLVQHSKLILALLAVQGNGAVPQTIMSKALRNVADKKADEWQLDKAHIASFSEAYGRRIRGMLRHWTQASMKDPPPRWIVPHLNKEGGDDERGDNEGGEEEDGEEEDGEGDEEETEDEDEEVEIKVPAVQKKPAAFSSTPKGATVEYMVGYSESMQQAWRDDNSGAGRTYTKDIFVHEAHARPVDSAWARWPDGYEQALDDLTVLVWTKVHKERFLATSFVAVWWMNPWLAAAPLASGPWCSGRTGDASPKTATSNVAKSLSL